MNDYDGVEILLVEDNPFDADLTMRLFAAKFSEKLLWLRDGVEALEFLHCTGAYQARDPLRMPKLMLLDLKMPRVDGLDVLREIKADDRLRTMPIVAMTSSNQDRDVAESYRLGVNGYVTKPLRYDDLAETIEHIGSYWLRTNVEASHA